MKNGEYKQYGLTILFDGTIEDFVSELKSVGFDLKTFDTKDGNKAILVEKTPTHKALDDMEDKNES